VDLACGKNLVGAYYQPKIVISDSRVLATLSRRQITAGLAEVIKYAVIADPRLFAYLESHLTPIQAGNAAALTYIVNRCAAIKAAIVGQDERETQGLRTILNFGHTLGHAIETAGGYRGYNHGTAVALGMLLALDISCRLRLLPHAVAQRIELLIKRVGLPTHIRRVSLAKILAAHHHDKKFVGTTNRFVLLAALGKTCIKENIPLEVIRQALQKRV
jgi:3-dehydroquinate synthase